MTTMVAERERRVSARMEKNHQVFCDFGPKKEIGKSFDISEKGVGFLTNLPLEPGDPVELQIFPEGEFFSITCDGTVRHFTPSAGNIEFKFRVGVEFSEGLKDFAVDQLIDRGEKLASSWTATIKAGPQECYDAICDLDSFPSWQKIVSSVNILERDSKSRALIGEIYFDFIIKKIRVVNKYEYFDKDFILSWKTIEGDIEAHEASYVFQQLRENRTSVVLSGFVIPGFYIPKRIFDYVNKITIRNSVRDLKKGVESGMLRK